MAQPAVGIILIVLGILFILAGFVGGVVQMIKDLKKKFEAAKTPKDVDFPVRFIEALIKFLEALLKAPVWLALIFIGIFLVGWGGTML